jgi:hypothetical protein
LGEGGRVAAEQRGLQAFGELGEVGGLVGCFAERAEHGRGDDEGGQSFAADIADDQADSVPGVGQGVEVSAYACVRGGGLVEGGDLQGADAAWDGP